MAQPITLEKAIQLYLETLKEENKHPRTLYTYNQDLKQVMAFFGPHKLVNQILKTQVGKFLKSKELLCLPNGKLRADKTVQKTIRVFRMFLIWAEEQHYLDELPLPQSILYLKRAKPTREGTSSLEFK